MEILKKHLTKELKENTYKNYLSVLNKLKDTDEIKDLNFIYDTDEIIKKIDTFKITNNTKRKYYSVLMGLTRENKKVYNIYDVLFKKYKKEQDDMQGTKTEKQEENWISKEELLNKQEELKKSIEDFKNKRSITEEQYKKALYYLVLSLYTLQEPRRNNDYINMVIIDNEEEIKKDEIKNYLLINKNKYYFIFNDYKTMGTYGRQIIKINDELKEVIKLYIKMKRLFMFYDKSKEHFLISHKGTPYKTSKDITLILNNIFNKNISTSLIRHIYLSDKFKTFKDDLKTTSEAMGTDSKTALKYYIV